MKVGIIIVTYNSQKDIKRLFDSIIMQRYNELVIYIVDNNSTDDTLSFIQKYQSELRICIISCKTNNGFAKGNNIGIQKAMDEGCDFVFILNPDMQLQEKCLNILIERIVSDEKIGVIGPIVLLGDNPDNIIQVYGVQANFRTQKKVDRFSTKKLTDKIPAENFVDFVLGGAMLIRCSILKIIGLFEEDYFMYNDEIDIAYRIKQAGFRTLCMRDAVVRHFHDFSKHNKTGYNLMYYYIMRNRYLYFKKFKLYYYLVLSLIVEIINIPLKIIWSIRRMGGIKLLNYYYSGLMDGLQDKKGLVDKSFEENKKAKEIILTADYELFLGEESGSVSECMIEPTNKLLSILEKNNSKMTVFWDILHYYRLLELERNFSELKQDRILIEEQILDLASRGHDIQLHLHPHWLDAKYQNSKWTFKYDRFKLHKLSSENNHEDINTIIGCVTISKKLMEDLITKVKPDYRVTTFRAGGYLIEPFEEIKDALLNNVINVDSSVCPHFVNNHGIFSFDFRSYPSKSEYNFEFTPKNISNNGTFIEIPITTVKISVVLNIFFTLLRLIKYSHLESERKGSSVGEYFKQDRIYFKKLFSFTHPRINQLTTDNSFKERFSYKIKKVSEYSTMILHPKLLNSHSFKILDQYVSSNTTRFISIQDYLS